MLHRMFNRLMVSIRYNDLLKRILLAFYHIENKYFTTCNAVNCIVHFGSPADVNTLGIKFTICGYTVTTNFQNLTNINMTNLIKNCVLMT